MCPSGCESIENKQWNCFFLLFALFHSIPMNAAKNTNCSIHYCSGYCSIWSGNNHKWNCMFYFGIVISFSFFFEFHGHNRNGGKYLDCLNNSFMMIMPSIINDLNHEIIIWAILKYRMRRICCRKRKHSCWPVTTLLCIHQHHPKLS